MDKLHGREVVSQYFCLQNRSLACLPSRLITLSWSKKLISLILHITHAQWIFRNLSLHHNIIGYLRLTQQEDVLAEIGRLSHLDHSLACLPSRLTTLSWSKKHISLILHITHAQWIFRDLSLNHNIIGYLWLIRRDEVLAEID